MFHHHLTLNLLMTAQGEECPCSTRGGGAAKRFKIELARGDQARGFDEAVRLLVRAREW